MANDLTSELRTQNSELRTQNSELRILIGSRLATCYLRFEDPCPLPLFNYFHKSRL